MTEKKSLILTPLILYILLIPLADATNTCLNNVTLSMEYNMTKNVSGVVDTLLLTEIKDCPHGCENDISMYGAACADAPFNTTLYIIVGIVLLFAFLMVVSKGK